MTHQLPVVPVDALAILYNNSLLKTEKRQKYILTKYYIAGAFNIFDHLPFVFRVFRLPAARRCMRAIASFSIVRLVLNSLLRALLARAWFRRCCADSEASAIDASCFAD
jgi:hypothetical protein